MNVLPPTGKKKQQPSINHALLKKNNESLGLSVFYNEVLSENLLANPGTTVEPIQSQYNLSLKMTLNALVWGTCLPLKHLKCYVVYCQDHSRLLHP